MPHEDIFLDDIRAHPEDDAPRLIYADWLTDRGDARGEFIAVQCELARGVEDVERRRWLERRERLLLAEHEERWLGPVLVELAGEKLRLGAAPWQASWQFRRGFVRMRSINLCPAEDTSIERLRQWLASPWLTGLRRLCLQTMGMENAEQAEVVAALTGAAVLRQLEHLDLENVFLPSDVPRRLLASPHLGLLRHLNLNYCNIDQDVLRVLISSASLPGLRELLMNSTCLLQAGLACLEQAAFYPELTLLDLGRNALGPGAVFHLHRLKRIQSLNLSMNDLGILGVEQLAGAPFLSVLRHLFLGGTRPSDHGVEALVRSGTLRQLRILHLAGSWSRTHSAQPRALGALNGISDSGAKMLAGCADLAGLASLDLGSNSLTDAGVAALAASTHLPGLEFLGLENNLLGPTAVRAVLASPNLCGLRRLRVGQDLAGAISANERGKRPLLRLE
jgi:uncharacterized protein (TIGR02996 family)